MNDKQAREELKFFESSRLNTSLLYSQLSEARKTELMLEAGRNVTDDLKKAPTVLAARELLHQEYNSLWSAEPRSF